jgi:hypothetical protein
LAHRSVELFDWWYLVERGEPVPGGGVSICRRAFAEAFGERLAGWDPRQSLRSPAFVPLAIAGSLVLVAIVSHGFSATRGILAVVQDMREHPRPGEYDWRGDRIAVYAAPILFALATGITLLFAGTLSLRARGLRYWGFLALKGLSVLILLPLFWVELGTVACSWIPSRPARTAAGLLTAIGFVIGMAGAAIWCVADQRRRCRICLRRLVLPVSVGSWASQFEPSATEMLCENGDGALALSDTEATGQDRWTRMDDSWKAMFR